jgi:hypothetical protein
MLELTAVCSEEGCDEEISIQVESLEELDEFMCECDCSLVLLRAAEISYV